MIKIITAVNNINLHDELKNENNLKIIGRDIQYKEGILELLENDIEINYIIIDEKIPGEIELNKLIEKILEKNKKIKIIILIKKENKNKINLKNKNLIKIYYEKEINLEILKNYNNNYYNFENISEENKIKKYIKNNFNNNIINKLINNKKINKAKIISFFGEPQVGKSLTIFNISNLLNKEKNKILIIELNSENGYFKTLFKSQINTKKIKLNNKKIKNKIKKINNKKYKLKYLNKKIINNSEENILIIRPNLIGIKNSKKIIEKNKLNKIDNLKILINNYNKNSVDEKIIKNIFNKNKIIGKINYEINYEKIINSNFKNKEIKSKEYNENLKEIINQIK